ncbi:MAG: extracellular solute-binding protein [Spirochaetia bacterium]|nr:extracellular solute-binding protein [Spirochaetia bacterium]
MSKKMILVLTVLALVLTPIMANGAKEAEAPAAAVEQGLKGEININLESAQGLVGAWEAISEAYMEKHPDVKINVDLKPAEGYGDWLKNQLSKDAPTADLVNINKANELKSTKSINLDEYSYDISPYTGKIWKDQYVYEMQRVESDHYGNICLESVQVMFFYNKQIFEEVGVSEPKTWDELVSVSEKLAAAGYQPLAVAGDYNSFWATQMGWLAQIYYDQAYRSTVEHFRSQPGDFNYDPEVDASFVYDPTDPWNDDNGKFSLNKVRAALAVQNGDISANSPGLRAVWENMKKVFPKYAGGDAFFGTKDALPLFYQGKAAMLVDGGWRIANFKRDMDKLTAGGSIESADGSEVAGVKPFDLGNFTPPSMVGPEFEAPARSIEVAVGFVAGVKKDQAQNELLVDFLMYFSSPEGFGKYMEGLLEDDGTPNGPPLVYGVELPAEYAPLYEDMEFVGNCQKGFSNFLARGVGFGVKESIRDWYGYTQQYLTDQISIEQWGAQHQQNIDKFFPDLLVALKLTPEDLLNPQNQPVADR